MQATGFSQTSWGSRAAATVFPGRVLALLLLLAAPELAANSGGVGGRSMEGSSCASCHVGGNLSSTISISGDSTVGVGASLDLAVVISTASQAGFNLSASEGSLSPGSNSRLFGPELTHSSPTASQGGEVVWNFTWTAPAQEGQQTLFVCGQPVNGNGSNSGDGPTKCTTKSISVQSANSPPSATNGSVEVNEGAVTSLTAADFGYSDADGDPLALLRIVSVPGSGRLFLDGNVNDVADPGETLAGGDSVDAADLSAGRLRYRTDMAQDASLVFRVNDGSDDSSASNTLTLRVNARPTVSLSSSAGDPVSVSPFTVSISFSESVTGLTVGDLVITNANVTLQGAGAAYSVSVVPLANGQVGISLPAGVAADAGGALNRTAEPFSVVFQTLDAGGDDDGDGMSNGFEQDNDFDPGDPGDAAGDADTDGLSNLEEFLAGTLPRQADTDLDGLPDGYEVELGFDPLASTADIAELFGDGAAALNVLADKGTGFTLLSVSTPANGSAAISGGLLIYTPGAGFVGNDSFSYEAQRDDGTLIQVQVLLNIQAASLTQTIEQNLTVDPAFRAQFVANLIANVAADPGGAIALDLQRAIQDLVASDPAFRQRFGAQFRAALASGPFELFVFIGDDNLQGRTESGDFNSAAAAFESARTAQTGTATIVLNCAQGGTSIAQWYDLQAPRGLAPTWLDGSTDLNLSNSCMEAIDGILAGAPAGGELRGVVVGLGGSDAVYADAGAPTELVQQWGSLLAQMIDHYRAAYGTDFDVVLLQLPALSDAGATLESQWQAIISAQQGYRNIRSQLLSTDGLETRESDSVQPLFSDAGQAQLALDLAAAFAGPVRPLLGSSASCDASTPCFPDTEFLIEPQRCERLDLLRSGRSQSRLCDQHGNSLHALQSACLGCLDLESLAAELGLGIVTTRIGDGFDATFFNRQRLGDDELEPLPYDSPFTPDEPRGCGFQDRESSTFVLEPGDYEYGLEALLSEFCNGESQSACDILSDPAAAERDRVERGISVSVGVCNEVIAE